MLQVPLANSGGEEGEDPQLTAQRILQSVVVLAVRIARIGQDLVTFDIPTVENFSRYKDKLWVSMIAEKNST